MAKRTKLTAPSAEDLAKLDDDFRSENRVRPNPATAPIASVAAEAALTADVEPAQQKLNRLDAERLRRAEEDGLLIVEIPTDQINEMAMIRDRTILEASELDELMISIRQNGLRLPIEVYKTDEGYALLSGYRRLLAVRKLGELLEPQGLFKTIKALIRPATDAPGAFVAMVEENEVRANLSHFERGRIAVLSASEGAFTNTEEAINALFASASAAKRSKVKSFAELFESLGDMLKFPEDLSERRGLRLAAAVRQGGERRLRAALDGESFASADEEWAALEPTIDALLEEPVKAAKRGRPRTPKIAGWQGDTLYLSNGISLRKEHDSQGHFLRIMGKNITADLLDALITEVQNKLERPK